MRTTKLSMMDLSCVSSGQPVSVHPAKTWVNLARSCIHIASTCVHIARSCVHIIMRYDQDLCTCAEWKSIKIKVILSSQVSIYRGQFESGHKRLAQWTLTDIVGGSASVISHSMIQSVSHKTRCNYNVSLVFSVIDKKFNNRTLTLKSQRGNTKVHPHP